MTTDLHQILDDCWRMLFRATQDKKSPLRTPAFVSVSPEGLPQARTLVLRKVERQTRLLRAYTDARAEKVSDLRAQPEVVWLFYHPRQQQQLRLRATVHIHHNDPTTAHIWQQLPPFARKNYATQQPPGTPTEALTNGLLPDWQAQTDAAYAHFVVLDTFVYAIDWLYLHPEVQHRARFRWQNDDWQKYWCIP